jgi:two-component system sensor histidine kinase DctS
MSGTESESSRRLNRSLPEALVRTLRHEVGDFLQKVYASIAILKDRIPPEKVLERSVLDRLRNRGEACRKALDNSHDFVCPLNLECQPLDLGLAAAGLMAAARSSFPKLELTVSSSGPAIINGDALRVTQVGELLLANACEAARSRVIFATTREADSASVNWTITDDGPGIDPNLAKHLFTPFFTTNASHSGLGLALARKLTLLHQGQISAGNHAEGGFQVRVSFPRDPAMNEGGSLFSCQ